jgi:hypothetical protein
MSLSAAPTRVRPGSHVRGPDTVAALEAENALLRRASAAQRRITTLAMEGASVREMADAIAQLAGNTAAIYDAHWRQLALAPCTSAHAACELERIVQACVAAGQMHDAIEDGPAIVPAASSMRLLVAPAVLGEVTAGAIVIFERTQPLRSIDFHLARSASAAVALVTSLERRRSGCAPRSRHLPCDGADPEPLQLLLASSGPDTTERFVARTLGPLLDSDDEWMVALLETAQSFFAHNRRIRQVAESLGVHENTVRKRLDRITEVTGCDLLGSAKDQLTLQVALLAAERRADLL